MDFIEDMRVRQECTKAGFRAKIDRPAAIGDAREIGWIRIAKLSPTQGNESSVFTFFQKIFRHLKIYFEC